MLKRWGCVLHRRKLLLLVGDDLQERERQSVEAHVRDCATCRERLASLRRSLAVLRSRAEPAGPEFVSLWPSIRGRLAHVETPVGGAMWSPWLALAAASVAIAVMLANRPDTSNQSVIVDARANPPALTWAPSRTADPGVLAGLDRAASDDFAPQSSAYFHLERAQPVGYSLKDF